MPPSIGGLLLRLGSTAVKRSPRVARQHNCAGGDRMAWGRPGTIMCPARPAGGAFAGSPVGYVAATGTEKARPGGVHSRRPWNLAPSVNEDPTHQERAGVAPTGRALGEGSRCGSEAVAPRSFATAKRRAGRSPEATEEQALVHRGGRRSLQPNLSAVVVPAALRCSDRHPGHPRRPGLRRMPAR